MEGIRLLLLVVVVLFAATLEAKKTKTTKSPEDPKLKADTAFTESINKHFSDWFTLDFVENMTQEACDNMVNGTTMSDLFSRYHSPYGMLPVIYDICDDDEIQVLNESMDALKTDFGYLSGAYSVDFALLILDDINKIFTEVSKLVEKDMKKDDEDKACAAGITDATKLITPAAVEKITKLMEEHYTEEQCTWIYDVLNKKMFDFDTLKFEAKKCKGKGPTIDYLVYLNNVHNLSGEIYSTVPPS